MADTKKTGVESGLEMRLPTPEESKRVPLLAPRAHQDRTRQEREDALDELARLGQEFDAS